MSTDPSLFISQLVRIVKDVCEEAEKKQPQPSSLLSLSSSHHSTDNEDGTIPHHLLLRYLRSAHIEYKNVPVSILAKKVGMLTRTTISADFIRQWELYRSVVHGYNHNWIIIHPGDGGEKWPSYIEKCTFNNMFTGVWWDRVPSEAVRQFPLLVNGIHSSLHLHLPVNETSMDLLSNRYFPKPPQPSQNRKRGRLTNGEGKTHENKEEMKIPKTPEAGVREWAYTIEQMTARVLTVFHIRHYAVPRLTMISCKYSSIRTMIQDMMEADYSASGIAATQPPKRQEAHIQLKEKVATAYHKHISEGVANVEVMVAERMEPIISELSRLHRAKKWNELIQAVDKHHRQCTQQQQEAKTNESKSQVALIDEAKKRLEAGFHLYLWLRLTHRLSASLGEVRALLVDPQFSKFKQSTWDTNQESPIVEGMIQFHDVMAGQAERAYKAIRDKTDERAPELAGWWKKLNEYVAEATAREQLLDVLNDLHQTLHDSDSEVADRRATADLIITSIRNRPFTSDAATVAFNRIIDSMIVGYGGYITDNGVATIVHEYDYALKMMMRGAALCSQDKTTQCHKWLSSLDSNATSFILPVGLTNEKWCEFEVSIPLMTEWLEPYLKTTDKLFDELTEQLVDRSPGDEHSAAIAVHSCTVMISSPFVHIQALRKPYTIRTVLCALSPLYALLQARRFIEQ